MVSRLAAGHLSEFLGGVGSLNGLSVAEGDTALGQIVGGKLQRDAVTGQDPDAVPADGQPDAPAQRGYVQAER